MNAHIVTWFFLKFKTIHWMFPWISLKLQYWRLKSSLLKTWFLALSENNSNYVSYDYISSGYLHFPMKIVPNNSKLVLHLPWMLLSLSTNFWFSENVTSFKAASPSRGGDSSCTLRKNYELLKTKLFMLTTMQYYYTHLLCVHSFYL